MKMGKQQKKIIFMLLCIGIISRLIPHVANFAPIFAIVAWFLLNLRKPIAVCLIFLMLLFSDIGLYLVKGYAFNADWFIINYLSYSILFFLPLEIRQSQKNKMKENASGTFLMFNHADGQQIVVGGFIFPVTFWLMSNGLVWLLSTFYTKNIVGLTLCFSLALPFLWHALLANLLGSMIIVFQRTTKGLAYKGC